MGKILEKYKELSNLVNYMRYMIEQEIVNNSLSEKQGGGRTLVLRR